LTLSGILILVPTKRGRVELPPEQGRIADATGPAIDLLEQLDLARDVIEGPWQRGGKALLSPPEGNPPGRNRIYLPTPSPLPQEYDMSLTLARREEATKGWEALNIGLASADARATFYIYGGEQSLQFGLANIGGKPANDNGTRQRIRDWPLNTPVAMTVQVRRPDGRFHVRALVEGAEVWRWEGDPQQLAPTWTAPDSSRLFLGSSLACRMDAITFAPVGDRGLSDRPAR
jgi:hypothetical protein